MTLTGRQIRDGRALTGLQLHELADRAGVGPDCLAYAKATYGASPWSDAEFDRVQRVLKAAGVIFIAEEGEGVRLRKADLSAV